MRIACTISVDTSKCRRCGLCASLCPCGAIEIRDNEIKVHNDRCICCYGCVTVCPEKAISIEFLDGSYIVAANTCVESRDKGLDRYAQKRQPSS